MSHTRGSPRPWSAVELAYIRENCGKLSVRQMAQDLGRPKSSVDRKAREARASGALGTVDTHAPAGTGPLPPDPAAAPESIDGRLDELASLLRSRVMEADERNVAKIAAEYRETLEALKGTEGDADDGGGSRLERLVRSLQP